LIFSIGYQNILRHPNDVEENLVVIQRMAMLSVSTSPPENDLLARWCELAKWAVLNRHGAAAKFAAMFALCLQRPMSANARYVQYVRPRIWQVTTPYGTSTQRAALFDDELIEALLNTIDLTAELPTPVFPRAPCGSNDTDVWAHSFASRKRHRGLKNFPALCSDFGLWPLKYPFEIYQLSMYAFVCAFALRESDRRSLLAFQLGSKRAPSALCVPWFAQPLTERIGELRIEGGDTFFEKGA
jgi:hypothetical protein